jgi:uncharacterized membrane protein
MNYVLIASRILYALTMIVFGVQHFVYAHFVAKMIPTYIPWHLFWTYFVGVAFIAAAVSIIINKVARPACVMLGTMIFLFVLLIQLPPVINNVHDGSRLDTAMEELGLSCCAFILGGTFSKRG